MLWVGRVWNAPENIIPPEFGRPLVLSYVAPFVIAPLSLASSLYILFCLLRKSNRVNFLKRPKEQLLVGLSVFDTLASFGLLFSTVPSPSVTYDTQVEWNTLRNLPGYGTIATCNAQGFLVQFGWGVPLYNLALAVYFVLSVTFRVSDKQVMKWVVPAFHSCIITFELTAAFTLLFLGLFNNAGVLGCWIHGREGKDHSNWERFELWFGIVPVAISFVTVVLSMIILTITIWRTERASRRRSFALTTKTRQMTMRDLPLTRRSIETGVLYSISFIVVYIPLGLQGLTIVAHGTQGYSNLRVLVAMMTPSQGLLNLLVFTMPTWRGWIRMSVFQERWRNRVARSTKPRGEVIWFGSPRVRARHSGVSTGLGTCQNIAKEEEAEVDMASDQIDGAEDTQGCSIQYEDPCENTEVTQTDVTSTCIGAEEFNEDPERRKRLDKRQELER